MDTLDLFTDFKFVEKTRDSLKFYKSSEILFVDLFIFIFIYF